MYKTKKNLRETLASLLEEKPFHKITVTEICQRAHTSRITFYIHYSDKYNLLEDLFQSMYEEMMARFEELQESNPDKDDPAVSYQNLLDTTLEIYYRFRDLLQITAESRDDVLIHYYYFFLRKCVDQIALRHADTIQPRYPQKPMNSMLVIGLCAYVHTADEEGMSREEIRSSACDIISDLVNSNLYIHHQSKKPRGGSGKTGTMQYLSGKSRTTTSTTQRKKRSGGRVSGTRSSDHAGSRSRQKEEAHKPTKSRKHA